MYAICWMSLFFTLMLVVNIRAYVKLSDLALLNNFLDAFVIIPYKTSVTNPLLYTFFKLDFWNDVRRLLPIDLGTNILTIASTKRVRSHRGLDCLSFMLLPPQGFRPDTYSVHLNFHLRVMPNFSRKSCFFIFLGNFWQIQQELVWKS